MSKPTIKIGCNCVKKRHSLADVLIDRIVLQLEYKDYPTELEYKTNLVVMRLKCITKGKHWWRLIHWDNRDFAVRSNRILK